MSIEPKFRKGDKVWVVKYKNKYFPPSPSQQPLSVFEGVVTDVIALNDGRVYRIKDSFFYEKELCADVRDALKNIKSKYYDYVRQYVTDIEDVIKDLEKQIKEQEEETI